MWSMPKGRLATSDDLRDIREGKWKPVQTGFAAIVEEWGEPLIYTVSGRRGDFLRSFYTTPEVHSALTTLHELMQSNNGPAAIDGFRRKK